ncbi:beta-lactamase/transpeptidase-like protein [Hypoxylon crocopeplum]|nr:beta-lactamase/transpeptidase-like protein [Hypoxylon crocopeplum]
MMRLSPSVPLVAAAAAALTLLSTTTIAQQDRPEQKVLLAGEGNPAEGIKKGSSPFDAEFKEFVHDALDRLHVPGLAVAVVDGEDTWAEGYGISSFPSKPVTPSTLFYTGSTTKAFTAAILSLLIASGNFSTSSSPSPSSYSVSSSYHPQGESPLRWQTPISHLLRDDFVLQPAYDWPAAHLTLEDALSHRTGFPRHDKSLARRYGPDAHPGTVRDVVRSLRHLPMVTEPRVKWRYCNIMFMVAAHVIQTLTGQWLGTTMRERIWEPLGMTGTYLSVEQALDAGEDVAEGYFWDYLGVAGEGGGVTEAGEGEGGGKGGFVKVPYASLNLASGAGGIVSNVQDYARWIRCLIRGDGDENGCPLLPAEAHRELKAARVVLPPQSRQGFDAPVSYALGWDVATYRGHRVFSHSGGMEAYGAQVYFFPDLEYGVVTLANTALTSNVVGWEVAWKLINEKIGVPEEERFDWTGLGKDMVDGQLKLADIAVETLYPEHADPPLPKALPLEEYVGVYAHPAYQNVKVELIDKDARNGTGKSELKAVRDNMEWQMVFEFQHVSGEFWAVVIDFLNTPNMLNGQLARAEFVISVKGSVDKLKMEFLEDGSEGIIVFDKVA